ncbi:MAG: hypothetical protein ABIP75_14925 [Pyrinomonadaceae bacterium]
MARGWESKAVEAQQDAATQVALRPEDALPKKKDTPEARARQERIASLEMSRNLTLDKLETAANPNYRQTLLRALSALDDELEVIKREP